MTTRLTRAKQLIEARMSDPAAAASIETAIATDLLGPATLARDADVRPLTYPQHGYLTPFEATEAFARELHDGIAQLAKQMGVRLPKVGKFDPLFGSVTLVSEVWRVRQIVDELGIPYWFYIMEALRFWNGAGNKRLPRPMQICTPEVVVAVVKAWGQPDVRFLYPVFDDNWDMRFLADKYVGDIQQLRALDLIDQRLHDAETLGLDSAGVLAPFLMEAIHVDEAVRRYGQDLVDRAMECHVGTAAHVASDFETSSL